jgi:hypothetical protein
MPNGWPRDSEDRGFVLERFSHGEVGPTVVWSGMIYGGNRQGALSYYRPTNTNGIPIGA